MDDQRVEWHMFTMIPVAVIIVEVEIIFIIIFRKFFLQLLLAA